MGKSSFNVDEPISRSNEETNSSGEQGGEPRTSGDEGTNNFSANGTGRSESQSSDGDGRIIADAPIEKKRRGRKPYPRDASGNIIRPEGTQAYKGTTSRVSVGRFTPNDRPKIRQQIQGIFSALATLTKQPVLILTDQEADAETNALCDVCDYHEINLTSAGGVYALYLVLIVTTFGIVKPRVDAIVLGGPVVNGTVTRTTTGAQQPQQRRGNGMMDFSSDIDNAMQEAAKETMQ